MKYLMQDEQKQLVRTMKETKGAERDYVIIELLLNTGLRASELCAVNVGDVRNKGRFYVQPDAMKNGRGRFVPLNVRIQDILRKWIAHKMAARHESIEDTAPLFVTKGGRRITRQDLTQSIIEKWMMRAGLTTTRMNKLSTYTNEKTVPPFFEPYGTMHRRGESALGDLQISVLKNIIPEQEKAETVALYSAHSLRHTCFKRMRERGVSLEVIQKIAGHKSLASTGIYTEATEQEIDEAVQMLSISPARAERMAKGL